jgi:hypothetical protein
MNNIVTEDLMDKTILLKNIVEGGHDKSVKTITQNYTDIKEALSEISMFKIEVLDRFKEKILKNILDMQEYYGQAMSDFVDCKKFLN